ncbi:DUF2076 domain-containing protein [Frateuria defendens]|uniref:DUF2076 domain-containing protein n=1 Tax=Frateuria defendens TaxID=2219559 RepID=UPI00066FBC22|nr:DUF2076 family protein [Frateuria defendens]
MTPQEQQLLEDFLDRLAAARGVAKDPQADALIRQRVADQPDALYLLVQRSLLQQQALENAKAEIARLQAQAGGQGGGSFLGGQQDWRRGQVPPPAPSAPPPAPGWRERFFGGGATPPPVPPPQAAGGGAPSFLASAATTAAGVAGGMFLFNGIESLIGGHQGGGLAGGQPEVVENVTQNNFYDDSQNDHDNSGFDNLGPSDDSDFADSGFDDDSNWS